MLTNSIRFSFPEPSCKAAVSSAYCRANDSSASAHGASQDGLAFAQDCLIAVPTPKRTRRMAMKIKKANKGHTKGKTLKPGKSLEKKQPLKENISFNYGGPKVIYTAQG